MTLRPNEEIEQGQEAGDGSANLQAAGNISGATIIQHNHFGVTEERVQALERNLREYADELWKNNAPELARDARDTYNQRAFKMTGEVITRAVDKDPELLERFRDPRAQVVLLRAQEAYGETGDDDLGVILAGLVVGLVGEPLRSRSEIAIREAIECAPRLTRQHLNALVVIVLLTRMSYRMVTSVDLLVDALDEHLSPYYGDIPTDSFEYSYMGATAAGVYIPGLGHTAYDAVFNQHRNAMYPSIPTADFPEDWTTTKEAGVELGGMLWAQRADPVENTTLRLTPDAADLILGSDQNAQPPLTEMQQKLRDLVLPRSINKDAFAEKVREQKPDLAAFFDTIDKTMALHFQPSPVGQMLAQHAIAARSPSTAKEMAKFFDPPDA